MGDALFSDRLLSASPRDDAQRRPRTLSTRLPAGLAARLPGQLAVCALAGLILTLSLLAIGFCFVPA